MSAVNLPEEVTESSPEHVVRLFGKDTIKEAEAEEPANEKMKKEICFAN